MIAKYTQNVFSHLRCWKNGLINRSNTSYINVHINWKNISSEVI